MLLERAGKESGGKEINEKCTRDMGFLPAPGASIISISKSSSFNFVQLLYHVVITNKSFHPEPLSLGTVFLQQHMNTMSNTMHTSPAHGKIPSINHHDMWKTTEKVISTKVTLYAGHQHQVTATGHEQHKVKTKSSDQWLSQHTQRTNTSHLRGYK